jgi:hypothetical protein
MTTNNQMIEKNVELVNTEATEAVRSGKNVILK